MISLKLVGCNYKTADLAVREHIAFSSDNIAVALARLNRIEEVEGGIILSTCNRTEICYVGAASTQSILAWMLDFHDFKGRNVRSCFYHYEGQEVVRHLVRVASGLESMVLGEPQVFGQMKDAYRMAKEGGFLSGELDGSWQRIFSMAKEVRTNTRLGERPVSVAALALRLAEDCMGSMRHLAALVVGAGRNASLLARQLKAKGIEKIYIANRSHDKAKDIALETGGKSIALMDIPSYLQVVDLVFTSTTSPTVIITKDMVAKAVNQRRGKRLFIADLSVPRDVESSVKEETDVSFFIMDDLQRLVQSNHEYRHQEAEKAQDIIETLTAVRTMRGEKEGRMKRISVRSR